MRDNTKLLLINLAMMLILVVEIIITAMSGTPFIAMVISIAVAIVAIMIFAARPYGEIVVLNAAAIGYALTFIGLCVADAIDPGLSPIVGIGVGIFAIAIQIWASVACSQGRI